MSNAQNKRHTGVPGQQGTTLLQVQAENHRLRQENAILRENYTVMIGRWETAKAYARSLELGERPSWQTHQAVFQSGPPLPGEVQAVHEAWFARRRNAIEDYVAQTKRVADEIHRARVEQVPTDLLPPWEDA